MIGKPTGPLGMWLPSLSTRRHEKKIRAKMYVAPKFMKASKTRNWEVRLLCENDMIAILWLDECW
jgi:hypothetical protein